jgi:hypothetical protein
VFKAKINGEGGSEVMGDLAFQMSNEEGHDCLTAYCVASHLLFDGKYDYEGENVIGKGSCSAVDCGAETFALTVVTSNTPKVIRGLTKQKIINPFALVMIAGGMLQGQEVGLGHKIQF